MVNLLGRHAPGAMAFGIFIGLAVQPLASVSKPMLMPAVWALLMLSMMRLEPSLLFAALRRPQRLGMTVFWMLVVTPLLMWGLLSISPLTSALKAALVLTAGSSALMSTMAVGIMMGLDGAFIFAVMVVSTILLPLTLPITALFLIGIDLEVGVLDLMIRLTSLVGSAIVVALLLRWLIGEQRIKKGSVALDGYTVLLLWLFAIPLMDGITVRLFAEPGHMLFLIILSFLVYVGLMLAGVLVFGIFWRDDRPALSAGLLSGCRNLGIIVAVLPDDAPPEIITFFALAQFPIYIMPSLTKPVVEWYLRGCNSMRK